MSETIEKDLLLLSHAADEAGRIALQYFGKKPRVFMKDGDSPVSEADFAVDHFLKKTLLEARPDYGWISEESDDERAGMDCQRFFVVDPIDGTRSFIGDGSEWCISIAIIEQEIPIAAVLECPVKREHFLAGKNQGAMLNSKKISVALPDLSDPFNGSLRIACSASVFHALFDKVSALVDCHIVRVAHIASLAYRLALLASGRIDGVVVSPGCHDWDIAAVDLIVRQSGGVLGNRDGTIISYGSKMPHGCLLACKAEYFPVFCSLMNQIKHK